MADKIWFSNAPGQPYVINLMPGNLVPGNLMPSHFAKTPQCVRSGQTANGPGLLAPFKGPLENPIWPCVGSLCHGHLQSPFLGKLVGGLCKYLIKCTET